jgi:hypothetical protein
LEVAGGCIEAQLTTWVDVAESDLALRTESSTDRWWIEQFGSSGDSGHPMIVADTATDNAFAEYLCAKPPLRSAVHSCNTIGAC